MGGYVAQEHARGCGIACLAMLLGWPYSKVLKGYFPEAVNRDLSEVEMMHFLNAWGFWSQRWWVTIAPQAAPDKLALACVDDGHWIVCQSEQGPDGWYWWVRDPARPERERIDAYRILRWNYLKRDDRTTPTRATAEHGGAGE